MGRGLKTEPSETNESADALKREPMFLEVCRYEKKKPCRNQMSDVREDKIRTHRGLWTVRVKGSDMGGGREGRFRGGIYSSRERKVTV